MSERFEYETSKGRLCARAIFAKAVDIYHKVHGHTQSADERRFHREFGPWVDDHYVKPGIEPCRPEEPVLRKLNIPQKDWDLYI